MATMITVAIVATDQASKPCAVSRNKASSEWSPVHRVRSRPAK